MKTTMTCMAAAVIAWATGGAAWACNGESACNTEAPSEVRAVIACESAYCNTETPPEADAKAA